MKNPNTVKPAPAVLVPTIRQSLNAIHAQVHDVGERVGLVSGELNGLREDLGKNAGELMGTCKGIHQAVGERGTAINASIIRTNRVLTLISWTQVALVAVLLLSILGVWYVYWNKGKCHPFTSGVYQVVDRLDDIRGAIEKGGTAISAGAGGIKSQLQLEGELNRKAAADAEKAKDALTTLQKSNAATEATLEKIKVEKLEAEKREAAAKADLEKLQAEKLKAEKDRSEAAKVAPVSQQLVQAPSVPQSPMISFAQPKLLRRIPVLPNEMSEPFSKEDIESNKIKFTDGMIGKIQAQLYYLPKGKLFGKEWMPVPTPLRYPLDFGAEKARFYATEFFEIFVYDR
jgi:hypothetical protein